MPTIRLSEIPQAPQIEELARRNGLTVQLTGVRHAGHHALELETGWTLPEEPIEATAGDVLELRYEVMKTPPAVTLTVIVPVTVKEVKGDD